MPTSSGAVATPKLRITACIILIGLACTAIGAADDALYYMPNGKAYMAINLTLARDSPGLLRMRQVFEKRAGVTPVVTYPPVTEKIYIVSDTSFLALGEGQNHFIITGKPGLAEAMASQFKQAGAKQLYINNNLLYTSGTLSLMPVGTTGALLSDFKGINKLILEAQANPGSALNNGGYQFISSTSSEHAISFATGAAPVVARLGQWLKKAPQAPANVEAAAAGISMISGWFDWNAQFSFELTFHVTNPANAQALMDTFNGMLSYINSSTPPAEITPDVYQSLKDLKAVTNIYGISIRGNFSSFSANKFLETLNNMPVRQTEPTP